MQQRTHDRPKARSEPLTEKRLPVWRTGLAGGVVGILCCVGPTLLVLFGVVGAGTAYAWANTLYDGHAWWFRVAGLALMGLLVVRALRRRGQCSLKGATAVRGKLLLTLIIAVSTYALLYAAATWLGSFAS